MNGSPPGTKNRILDTAERLFAQHGFDAVSLRKITSGAGVNLAAVNYHFQSKEALVRAVIERRMEPMTAERLRLLDYVEGDDDPPRLCGIIEAFLLPVLDMKRNDAQNFVPLMARVYCEQRDIIEAVFHDHLLPVSMRFRSAFERALPDLPPEEITWRVTFLAGAMVHSIAPFRAFEPEAYTEGVDWMVARMVTFFTAGFQAPATGAEGSRGD